MLLVRASTLPITAIKNVYLNDVDLIFPDLNSLRLSSNDRKALEDDRKKPNKRIVHTVN